MKDLISIIVPIYNAGSYLSDCIQSVLQQTYPYFELILIDDGSQDDSKKICKNLSNVDERIVLLSQNHQGVSVARNNAIKASTGKYLFFLDSDDMIHPCLLEVLSTILNSTHAAIAAAEYNIIASGTPREFNRQEMAPQSYSEYIHLDNQTALYMFVQGHTLLLYGIGGIMIRRPDTPLPLFDSQLPNGEDTKFIYQMLLQNTDVIILHRAWYYYRKYENSNSSKRTIDSCTSIYKCECYIRNSEAQNHRRLNALKQEHILLKRMCEWYITSHKNKDMKLCNYLKKLASHEQKSEFFLQTDLCMKTRFFFVYYCFPLYWIFRIICNIYHSFIKILTANRRLQSKTPQQATGHQA